MRSPADTILRYKVNVADYRWPDLAAVASISKSNSRRQMSPITVTNGQPTSPAQAA